MNRQRQQELEQIKRTDMRTVLSFLNISADRSGMFLAVWRGEKCASCNILQDDRTGAWVWHDHGSGDKGTNIDLVMRARGWNYVESVRWLRENFLSGNYTAQKKENVSLAPIMPKTQTEPAWQILENEHPCKRFGILLNNHRRVDPKDCTRTGIRALRIQYIKKPDMKFWLCAHQNLAGGWHGFFPEPKKKKYIIAPDGLGWHKGTVNALIITESILDGLACRKLYQLDADIVYARVPLAARLGKALLKRPRPYSRIVLAMDNDKSGHDAAQIVSDIIGQTLGPVERMPLEFKDPCDDLMKGAVSVFGIHLGFQALK